MMIILKKYQFIIMRILLNLVFIVAVVMAVLFFFPFSMLVLLGILLFMLYFLPSYIAFKKNHPNAIIIFIVNLLFGFTLIVWLICLILAIVYQAKTIIVEKHHYHRV